MRIIVMSGVVLVSLISICGAYASGPEHIMARHINCCMSDGQCLKTRRQHCDEKGGRVVENCKDCKAEWSENKPQK